MLAALFLLFAYSFSFGQEVIDPSANEEYANAKLEQAGPEAAAKSLASSRSKSSIQRTRGVCNDNFIDLDDTFTAIPTNDDGSFGPIDIPFTFNLYGNDYTSLYINTNGNVTFNDPLWQYSADGFPISTPMIAPFWADVDTRQGGMIYYKILDNAIIITWDQVGYFSQQTDKLNEFQMILTDGTTDMIGFGNNIRFNYEDMQWTTGSASQGSNGFGGIPATVGINEGDGVDFVQIGRFNINDDSYDGAGGENDGISFLDCKTFDFNGSNAENIAPASYNFPTGNYITLNVGETVNIQPGFIGPEVFQTVATVVDLDEMCDVTYTVTDGANSVVDMAITGSLCNVGVHTITFTATDNGTPAATTTVELTVEVINPCNVSIALDTIVDVDCNGASTGGIYITPVNGIEPYSYTWSTNATTQNISGLTVGSYDVVVVDALGCRDSAAYTIEQPEAIELELTSPTVISDYNTSCNVTGDGSIQLDVAGGVAPYTNVWNTGDVDADELTDLVAGTYSVEVTDANGCIATETIELTRPENCNCNPEIPTPSATCADCENTIDGLQHTSLNGGINCIETSYNSGISMNGATLVICGDAEFSYMNLNGANTIVVLGTLTLPQLNVNTSDVVIENYGTIVVNGWSAIAATVANYGDITFAQGLNINTASTVVNGGNFTVEGSLNINGTFINNSYLTVGGDTYVNSNSQLINNCTMDLNKIVVNAATTFENNGTMNSGELRFNSIDVTFGSGSIVNAESLYASSTNMTNVAAGSCNLLSITGTTEFNNGSISGPVAICDEDGVEQEGSVILLDGATFDCEGCTYSSTTVAPKDGQGTEEIPTEEPASEINIFPVPVSASGIITVETEFESFNVTVVNSVGFTVYSSAYNHLSTTISANILGQGSFVVRVINNETNEITEATIVVE